MHPLSDVPLERCVRGWRMRTGTTLTLDDADRRRLEAIVADRNTPQKHVWRWQERFAAEGVDGLLRDETRPPGKAPITAERAAEVVRLTLASPPHQATHGTAQAMAHRMGLAVSTVQKIWKAHGLAPHRFRTFKLSNDPAFAEKLEAIVRL